MLTWYWLRQGHRRFQNTSECKTAPSQFIHPVNKSLFSTITVKNAKQFRRIEYTSHSEYTQKH